MPKIPTFTSEARPTAQAASVVSNIKIGLNQTVGAALAPLGKAAEDYYVKEKKLEADNKAYALLSDMYIDQKDANGNIVQKGLFTIQSETKNNGEPTNAAAYNDQEVNKLYQYFKNNKFDGVDNFTKKAIESKYFTTAGILKTKSLEGSRNTQITDSTKIDEDYISKEAIVLKDVGPVYFQIYNQKVIDKITANSNYDDGQKKILIEAYKKFGAATLAESMVNNQPMLFKQALKKGQFDILNPEEKNTLITTADEKIKEQKFNILLKPLDISFDADPRDFTLANEEIKNKTFGGNKELQKIFQTLRTQEKIEFEKEYQKKAKAIRSDRNMAILTQREVVKVKTAIESKNIFDNMEKNKATYTKDLERIFGVNTAVVEQFTLVNEKVADGSANKLSNFDKNDDILKLIINDKINTIGDKFLLTGETGEGKSILERIGQDVNIADVKYLNNLLGISNEPNFKQNHTEFFKFIDNFKDQVAGSVALQPLDPNKDARLNKFKYVMYNRYIDGLEKGINSDELLKATKGNKNFIGYDFYTFLPDVNDVFIGISNELKKNINNLIEQDDTPEIPFISLKREKEKELGRKLTIQEFRELTKEN